MAPGPATTRRLFRFGRLGRALRGQAPLLGFLVTMVAFYLFLVSAGRGIGWPTWTAFNDAQAEGFRQGHLYLPEVPSKALQALPDPLNPVHMPLWRWDRSYYKGHFFLYWGLVPALVLAAVKAVFQIRGMVTDDVLTFVVFLGRLLAGTWLIRGLARRIDPRPPPWAVGLAMGVFALAHPTPYTLVRGAIYEAAIGAGALCMTAGLGFALPGIFAGAPRAATRWLAAASVCFGLAGGSRASLLPAVALLVAFTAVARWRIEGAGRARLVWVGLATCGPAAALTLAHLLLNRLRYDAWTEFGSRYQMGEPLKVGLRFVVPDLFAYLFCPPTHRCTFPFLYGLWTTTRVLSPSWLSWPIDHRTFEPNVGLFVVVLFAWLAPAGLLFAIVRHFQRFRHRGVEDLRPLSPSPSSSSSTAWRWRWVWGAPILYTVASGLPLFLLSSATVRYEADFASGLLLIATLCGWRLLSAPASTRGRLAMRALYLALAVLTIIAGVLLGLSGGYFESFNRYNPQLLHHLQKIFNVCHGP